MIGAEPSAHATGRSTLRDRLSMREIDHVDGIHIACAVDQWRWKVAGVDLGQKLRLNVAVVNSGTIIGRRRSDLEEPVKRAIPNRLVRAAGSWSVVLRQQIDVAAVGAQNIAEEAGHAGRCSDGNLRQETAGSVQHLYNVGVGNHWPAKIRKVRSRGRGGCYT